MLKDILERNGVDYEEGDWTNPGDTLIDLRYAVIKRIRMYQERIIQGIAHDFENMKIVWLAKIEELKTVFDITDEELQ